MICPQDRRNAWIRANLLPHESALRAWLQQRRISSDEIDDVVQETYKTLAGAGSVAHISNPRAYMFVTAQSIYLQNVRRAKRLSLESIGTVEHLEMDADRVSPERVLMARQTLGQVDELISALPEKCRQAFWLRRMEGLSQREVAHRMGVSENTIEKHVGKGLRVLARALAVALLYVMTGTGAPFLQSAHAAVESQPEAAPSPIGHRSALTGLLLRDEVTSAMVQTASGDSAMQFLMRISLHDRAGLTPGLAAASEEVEQLARAAGLTDVVRERFASDGVVDYFGIPSQRLWTVEDAQLWMTSPVQVRLASHQDMPCRWFITARARK